MRTTTKFIASFVMLLSLAVIYGAYAWGSLPISAPWFPGHEQPNATGTEVAGVIVNDALPQPALWKIVLFRFRYWQSHHVESVDLYDGDDQLLPLGHNGERVICSVREDTVGYMHGVAIRGFRIDARDLGTGKLLWSSTVMGGDRLLVTVPNAKDTYRFGAKDESDE